MLKIQPDMFDYFIAVALKPFLRFSSFYCTLYYQTISIIYKHYNYKVQIHFTSGKLISSSKWNLKIVIGAVGLQNIRDF